MVHLQRPWTGLILKEFGVSDETIAKQHNLQERRIAVLKQEKDNAVAEKKLYQIMQDEVANMSKKAPFGCKSIVSYG
jgi:hypothetical protein